MTSKQLTPEEKLEKAFEEDEYEFAEDIRNMDTYQPAKIKNPPVGGEMGAMAFGETLDLDGDGDAAAADCRDHEDDALLEDFFHVG